MYTFCTLFDSNYLDKGIVLYQSLQRVHKEFQLFVFAFDDKCFDILVDMNLSNMIIISLQEFETDEMLKVKKERTKAEYCWTCTPITIEYVLQNYDNVDYCTYIDCDMMFFSSVEPIFDEMILKKASILITPHRFPENEEGRKAEKYYGRYCVQFNTFKNDKKGLEALIWWKERCLERCSYERKGETLGDQKYLDGWTDKFEAVLEIDNFGAGLAPWNIAQAQFISQNDNKIKFLANNKRWNLIFYHFQNIKYLSESLVNIAAGNCDLRIKKAIYYPYLLNVEKVRLLLYEKYGLTFNFHRVCSSNFFIYFLQKYIIRYKILALSDLVNIKNIEGRIT